MLPRFCSSASRYIPRTKPSIIVVPSTLSPKKAPTTNIPRPQSTMAETVRNFLAENLGGKAQALGTHQFGIDDVPDLTDKVAVVTGGSEGIGYGVSHTLLSRNAAHVHLLSVSADVVSGALEAIASELGQAAAERVSWHRCDLTDWAAVARTADAIAQKSSRLDILVNNAGRGIMTAQLDGRGVDRHMSLNHFGHAVLTARLLPLLKRTAEAGHVVRVANQASNAHQAAPADTDFASLASINRDAGPNAQYGRSKLANILYSRYLARHLAPAYPNILVNATHPGFVRTEMSVRDIHEPFPLGGYAMSAGMKPFQKDQFEGALSALFAATVAEKSGEYICPPAVPEPGNELSRNEELGEQLMKLTKEIIEEKTGEKFVAY